MTDQKIISSTASGPFGRPFEFPPYEGNTVAAIDLGTTSCRLLIARSDTTQNWRVIDSFARLVRLGEGLLQTEKLSEEAMDRALQALRVCKEKMDAKQVTHLRAVTTEACRRAQNSDAFLKLIADEVSIPLEIISPMEEARLALAGCSEALTSPHPYVLLLDIGGGSTELMWIKKSSIIGSQNQAPDVSLKSQIELIDSLSIPFGVVTLSERFRRQIHLHSMYHKVRKQVSAAIHPFVKKHNIMQHIMEGHVQMVGTSGTVTTLAAIHQGLTHYDRRLVHALELPLSQLRQINRSILSMTYTARLKHRCIGPGRADLVIVGASILEGIFDCTPVYTLKISDRGVREGILSELFRTIQKVAA